MKLHFTPHFLYAFLFIPFAFLSHQNAQAQGTYTAVSGGGDWNNAATWTSDGLDVPNDGLPDANDIVIVPSFSGAITTVTITGSESCASLTVGSTPTASAGDNVIVTINVGATLNVAGAVTIEGPTQGSSTTETDYILDVNDGSLTASSITLLQGTNNRRDSYVRINNGTATISGDITATHTANASRNYIDFDGAGTLNVGGAFIANINALLLSGSSTVNYTGAAQNLVFDDYDTLTLSGSGTNTYTAAAALDLAGDLNIAGSVQLDVSSQDVTCAGGITSTTSNATPFVPGTGTFTFDGSQSTLVSHTAVGGNALTFNNLTLGGGNGRDVTFDSGTIQIGTLLVDDINRNQQFIVDGATVTVSGAASIQQNSSNNGNNEIIVNSGTLNLNSLTLEETNADGRDARFTINGGSVDVSGSILMNGSELRNRVLMTGNGSLNIEGSITGGLFDNSGTGTLTFDGAGSPTFGGAGAGGGGLTYTTPSLTVSGATLTLGAPVSVEGNLTINTGSLDVTASNHGLSIGGDWTNNAGAAAFVEQAGTVTFNGAQVQTIQTNETFNNLTATANNTNLTIAGATVATPLFSVESNAIFTVSSGTLNATTLSQSSTNNSVISGSGVVNTTSTTLTTGAEFDYSGTGFTATNLTLDASGGSFTVRFNSSASGVSVTNLTLLGNNADYNHTTGTATFSGLTTINAATSNNENTLNITGGSVTLASIRMEQGGTPSDNQDAVLIINDGSADVNGNIEMEGTTARCHVDFTGTGNLNCSGNILGGDLKVDGGSGSLIMDGAGAQQLAGLAGSVTLGGTGYVMSSLTIENSSVTTLADNISLTGNMLIQGNGVLDVDATNNFLIELDGNWTNTSGAADPFLQRDGVVEFDGAGVQLITTAETFDSLYLANTGTVVSIAGQAVNASYTYLRGNTNTLALTAGATLNSTDINLENEALTANASTIICEDLFGLSSGATVAVSNGGTLTSTDSIHLSGSATTFTAANATLNTAEVNLASSTKGTVTSCNWTNTGRITSRGSSGTLAVTSSTTNTNSLYARSGTTLTYFGNSLTVTDSTGVIGSNTLVDIQGNGFTTQTLTVFGSSVGSTFQVTSGNPGVNGNTLIQAPTSGGQVDIVVNGGTLTTVDILIDEGTSPTNSRDAVLSIGNGNIDCNGNLRMNGSELRCHVDFVGTGDLNLSGHLEGGGITYTGTTAVLHMDGNGTQNLGGDNGGALNGGTVSYDGPDIIIENSSATTLVNDVTFKDFDITGNASFNNGTDVDLSLRGDFTIQASAMLADPFIENNGFVSFIDDGTHGLQTIENQLGTSMNFHGFQINNTSGLTPGVETLEDLNLEVYDHNAGQLTLNDHDIILVGADQEFSNIDGGSLVTTGANSSFTITDPTRNSGVSGHSLTFDGTIVIGDATNGIAVTGTDVGDVFFHGGEIYGAVSFIRDKPGTDNTCRGGMTYHDPVYWEIKVLSDRWRFADTEPDIYLSTCEVVHDGVRNFILGRGSVGNQYHGDVILRSSTSGGIYIGRDNMNRATSNTLFGDLHLFVSLTGTIFIANGDSDSPGVVTMDGGTITLNSTATSTGDVNLGEDEDEFTQLRLINGATIQSSATDVLGATHLKIRNMDQTTAGVTSNIALGGSAFVSLGLDAPSDTLGNNWSGNLIVNAPRVRSMLYNTFNGTTYQFRKTGGGNDDGNTLGTSSNGGNTFAAGSSTIFESTSTSTGRWRLGAFTGQPNDYNGSVTFLENGSSSLQPCYNEMSTFSGNISTVGSSSVVEFGANGGGMIIDATTPITFDGDDLVIPEVNNLQMDATGTGALDLEVDLEIIGGGSLTLNDGNILTDATNLLIFEDQTASTDLGDITSYIEGPCQWNVTNNGASYNLRFPVGDATEWRACELDVQHSASGTFSYTAEMVGSSAASLGYTMAGSIDQVSNVRYWDIQRSAAGGLATSTVTLHYGTTPNDDGVTTAADVRVAKTDGAGTNWFDMGGAGTANNTGSVTSSVNFTSFSLFTFANVTGGLNPLPVELIEFDALYNGQDVEVSWATATEINSDYFEVQRSTNGIDFEAVTEVRAAGNSTQTLNYFALDADHFTGVSYYRLKQVDWDGSFEYSKVIAVLVPEGDQPTIALFPNPTTADNINLSVSGLEGETVQVVLHDMTGRAVYQTTLTPTTHGATQALKINAENVPAGSYLLTATSKDKVFSERIIVTQ